MQRESWIIVMLLCIEICSGAGRVDSSVIKFPSDRSMGILYVLDSIQVDTGSYDDWELLCEAMGDVIVPAGKALRLDLGKEAGHDLTPLSALASNDLVVLNFEGAEITDDQLKHISNLTGLQELDLSETNILGTGLKYLARLDSLKKLWLANTHVGDNELSYLLELPCLEGLGLRDTPTTDTGMVHVGKITSLETLSLGWGIGDEGLSHLKNLISLRSLKVNDRSISDKGISHLAGMTQMESLQIQMTQTTNEGLRHLEQMKKLKSLNLMETRVTEEGLVHLKGLTNLEHLRLFFPLTDVGLMHLTDMTSLKSVPLDENSVTPQGLDVLSGMKSLAEVFIHSDRKNGSYKTDAIVKKLAGSLKLKSLFIYGGLTDEGLVHLKKMPSLQILNIFGSQVTGKGISALTELPYLKALSFSGTKLTNDGWAPLGKLSSLESLGLHYIQFRITDADIANLSGLHHLKRLTINLEILDDDESIAFGITDKSLRHISKLKDLEVLRLTGAKITNEGLQHLTGLRELEYVGFNRCGISEQDLEQLKKKLSGLQWDL